MHSKISMEKHEATCYKNLENKTCTTCDNQLYSRDSEDEPFGKIWHVRGCKISAMNDFFEQIHDDLEVGGMKHIKPLFHCPNHNQTEEQPGTYSYCADVKAKIDLRKQQLNDNSIPF